MKQYRRGKRGGSYQTSSPPKRNVHLTLCHFDLSLSFKQLALVQTREKKTEFREINVSLKTGQKKNNRGTRDCIRAASKYLIKQFLIMAET